MFKDTDLNKIQRLFNQISTEVYGLQRANLEATTFVPKQNGVNEWAGSFTYKKLSELGMAKLISDYAEDLPPVARGLELKTIDIRDIGCSYGYSEAELNQWLVNGIDLSRDEADTARRAIDEKVDEIILKGDSSISLEGLLNNSNVSTTTIEGNGATTSSTKWKDKTTAQIVKDVQAMITTISTGSKNTIKADSLLVPTSAFVHIATTQIGENCSDTILDYLKRVFASQGLKNIDECGTCDGIGTSSADRLVLYKRDPSCVAYVLPIPFRQKEAQACSLHYSVPCYARVGGTIIKNLKSITYGDGV